VGKPRDSPSPGGAKDPGAEAIRAFNRRLRQGARVCLSVATVGDGLMLAHKL